MFLGYHPQTGLTDAFDPAGFEPRADKERVFWLDMEAPTSQEIGLLESLFAFHPLAVADCRDGQHRAKVTDFGDHLFVTLYAVSPVGHYPPQELNVFLAANFLVSVHQEPLNCVTDLNHKCRQVPDFLAQGPGLLFYELSDAIAAGYFDLFDHLDEEIGALEELIFTRPGRRVVNAIFALRRRLIGLRRHLGPQRDLFGSLARREDLAWLPASHRVYLGDVYEQHVRLTDQLATFHDLASNVLEAYLSLASNRLNEVVKVLTVITTIMMPLSLIAGIYGMNFRYMPELTWRYGYYYALGLMAAVGAGMLYYFHRKRWL